MNLKNALLTIFFTSVSYFVFAQQNDTLPRIDIEEVRINAFRVNYNFSDLPHKVEVYNSQDLSQIPSESITDFLKKTASIDVLQYPSMRSQVGMRGFSPSAHNRSYTMMLIDGLPSGTENLSTIGLKSVEQVEVMKGSFSSFFGSDAMAGVINIITPRSKGKIGGSAGLEYGSFQTKKAIGKIGGSLSSDWNFDFSANVGQQSKDYRTGSNNLLRLSDIEESIIGDDTRAKQFENTTYQKLNSSLRVGHEINNEWQIHSYTKLFIADDVYANGNFWGVYGDMKKDIDRWSQSIHVERETDNHSLKIAPYFNNEQELYYNEISDSNFVDLDKDFKEYGFIAQNALKIGDHELIAGVDNHSRRYSNKRWEDDNSPTAPYNPDYRNMATGIFLQTKLSFLDDKFIAVAGGRFDHVFMELFETDHMEHETGEEQYTSFNPKLGIQYSMTENFRIHSSYGTAFMTPDAFQKAGSYSYTSSFGTTNYKGNPDLVPEQAYTFDAGIDYNNRSLGLSSDLTYFYSRHNDMIIRDRSHEDYTSFKNANKAKMHGIEFRASYDLGAISGYDYSLNIYTNLTHLLDAKIQEDQEEYENMKEVRKNNASFGIEYHDFEKINLRFNSRFIGNRYEDNWLGRYDIRSGLDDMDRLKHPRFMVFDFSGTYTLYNNYELGIKIENIFDELYTERDGYYMPGRRITGSLTYNF